MIQIEEGFAGGQYARRYMLSAGERNPSHRHRYAHHTILCGRFLVWMEGYENWVQLAPGTLIYIEAGRRHQFQALEDGAVYICMHQLHDAEGHLIDDDHGYTLDELRAITCNLTLKDDEPFVAAQVRPELLRESEHAGY